MKRIIDILMKSDSRAVLFENKIFAAVNNPFDDYATYLDLLRNEDGANYKTRVRVRSCLRSARPAKVSRGASSTLLTQAS